MIIKADEDWFKNEDFWIQYKPLMFDKDRIEDTEKEVDSIIRLAAVKPGAAILDTCCGYGRHSLVFARKGCNVTGIDLSQAYLEEAVSNAKMEGLEIDYQRQDIREYNESHKFDVAVNYFSSFGYFQDETDDILMARNVFESLKPGGRFLIETRSKETACLQFKEREWFQRDGYIIILEYKLVDACTRILNRWLFIKDDHNKENQLTEVLYHIRLYSALEMARLLTDVGFSEVEFYGGIDGRSFDHNAETMIAVATK